ncbi:MAG: peptidylprolyl isomerase, partial [Opitutales bacterium]
LKLMNLSEQEKQQRSQELIKNRIENLLVIREFESEGRFIPESYLEAQYNKRLIRDFDNDRVLFLNYLRSKSQTQLDFRRDLERDIIIGTMYAKFRSTQADVSPERVTDYYNNNKGLFIVEAKVHLREIKLESAGGEIGIVTLQEAKDLHKQLKIGIPFADLAKKHGQSPLRNSGGDWGTLVAKEEISNEQLREKAFALEEGEFTEPFTLEETKRNEEGKIVKTGKIAVYILKAVKKQPAGYKSLEEVRLQVERIVAKQLDRRERTRWVARLRKKAYVKYFGTSEN